jgi:hypothetical protein
MHPYRTGHPPSVARRALVLSTLVLLATASVVCVTALLLAWRGGAGGPTAAGALAGILCALVCLLFITVFHFRRETMALPLENRSAFLDRLRGHLEELGYVVSQPADDRLVGRPAFHALLFGGNIEARLGAERAVLTGPKVYLETLRRRLRLHTHLEQMPHTLAVVRRRQGGLLLREVSVRVQVPGELLLDVFRELAGVLTREGAAIHCDLTVRARGENGLREQVLRTCIADWLKEQEIPAEVHQEPLVPEETVRTAG